MAARGAIAKEKVTKIIQEAFGENFVCELDKKLYVWSEENGEKIQVSITLTCPKNPVGGAPKASKFVSTDGFGLDFENMPAAPAAPSLEYTQEEKDTINKLIAELGL